MKCTTVHRKCTTLLATGDLAPGEAAAAQCHLSRCDTCRQRYRELRGVCELAASLPAAEPDVPSATVIQLHSAVQRELEGRERAAIWAAPRLAVAGTIGAVLLAVLLIMVTRERPAPPEAVSLEAPSFLRKPRDIDLECVLAGGTRPTFLTYRLLLAEGAQALDQRLGHDHQRLLTDASNRIPRACFGLRHTRQTQEGI